MRLDCTGARSCTIWGTCYYASLGVVLVGIRALSSSFLMLYVFFGIIYTFNHYHWQPQLPTCV